MAPEAAITGHCYCGASRFCVARPPLSSAYCHCDNCRRWTGAPVAGFAAFPETAPVFEPALGPPLYDKGGVRRWTCPKCGSPLMASFEYLPDQVYIPLGLIDQADSLPPQIHCHDGARFSWLDIHDDISRSHGSGRDTLNDTATRGRS